MNTLQSPPPERQPFIVHCSKCHHEWAPCFLPIGLDVMGRLKSKCPLGCRGAQVLTGPFPKATRDGDWRAWFLSGDTGTSSETIWSVMTGCPVKRHGIPWDPADFGRCYRLLQVMPSWRANLRLVADAHPQWAPLVEAWDELTALYEDELVNGPLERGVRMAPKTYARMKQLIESGRPRQPVAATEES